MTLSILNPGGGPDVTRRNRQKVLYIKGDENTDGSFRIILGPNDEKICLEERVSGVWILAQLKLNTGNWVVDDNTGNFVIDDNTGELVLDG